MIEQEKKTLICLILEALKKTRQLVRRNAHTKSGLPSQGNV